MTSCWLQEADCAAVLHSLLHGALATYRGVSTVSVHSTDVDSLERLHLAACVNEFFCVHETGAEDRLLMTQRFDDWSQVVVQAVQHTTGLAFRTSGSTGSPTTHVHRWAHIDAEAKALARCFDATTTPDRVVSWVPLHHLYGFMLGVALPRVLGVPLLVAESATPPSLQPGDLLVTVPPRWDYLARSVARWPASVMGVSSTAPLAATTADALASQGLSRLLEIYGSTETGGVATRWRRDAAYTLLPHWQRDDNDAQRISRGDGSAAIALLDAVRWHDGRTFTLGARLDDVVVIGGVNVSPEYVARRLRALPSVAECTVRATGSTAQQRLKAFIVPVHSSEQAEQEISQVTAQWPAAERPVGLTFGDALPANAMGKHVDW